MRRRPSDPSSSSTPRQESFSEVTEERPKRRTPSVTDGTAIRRRSNSLSSRERITCSGRTGTTSGAANSGRRSRSNCTYGHGRTNMKNRTLRNGLLTVILTVAAYAAPQANAQVCGFACQQCFSYYAWLYSSCTTACSSQPWPGCAEECGAIAEEASTLCPQYG
jgi:hypothetical protein